MRELHESSTLLHTAAHHTPAGELEARLGPLQCLDRPTENARNAPGPHRRTCHGTCLSVPSCGDGTCQWASLLKWGLTLRWLPSATHAKAPRWLAGDPGVALLRIGDFR